nr:MAG TPA: NinB protein [Caudoviricetes sp.]
MIGNAEKIIQWLFQQDREKIFEIKEKKAKRTLTQNAYYWVLLHELAKALKIDNDTAHKMMLERYGVYEVISVLNGIDLTGYFKYFDEIGSGTVNGKQFTHYKIFKGSSQMDSKEFAVLLDGLISDCEELGIPTLTREEIAKLKYIEMREK